MIKNSVRSGGKDSRALANFTQRKRLEESLRMQNLDFGVNLVFRTIGTWIQ